MPSRVIQNGWIRIVPLCEQYQQEFFRVTEYSTNVFKKAGCDLLHIRTGDDYVKVLQRFFVSRNR